MRQATQEPDDMQKTCAPRNVSRRRHVPIIMVYDRRGCLRSWEFPYGSNKVSEKLYDDILRP